MLKGVSISYNYLASSMVLQSFKIRIGRFRFDSKVTGRFENAAPAIVPQTTLIVQQKTSTIVPL